MKTLAALTLSAAAFASLAQEQGIQRSAIQRDQQGAEFAARVRGAPDLGALQELHARQLRDAGSSLHPDPEIARQLQPYERQRMTAESRELRLAPPRALAKRETDARPAAAAPLPLPGGPRPSVDVIPSQGADN
jgi:hypothetical protein